MLNGWFRGPPSLFRTALNDSTYCTPSVVIMLHIYVYASLCLKSMIITPERFLTHSNGF